MSEEEFMNGVVALFPNALISENELGEIVIETGLKYFGDDYIDMTGDR
jgi:hypothetical protein